MFSDNVVTVERRSPFRLARNVTAVRGNRPLRVVARLAAATALVLATRPESAFAGGVSGASAGSSILNPGQGVAPPGSAQLTTLVGYVAWAVFALCVVGVLMAAAQMAVAHQRGAGAGEHASRLGWVLASCVVAGSASALVGALA